MVLPLAFGGHPGGAHQGHPPVQGVEKQADVLDHKGPPGMGGGGCFQGVEELLDQRLCLGDGKPAFQDSLGGPGLQGRILQGEQGTGVALCDSTVPQGLQDRGGQLQQAELVGYRRLALSDAPGRLLLGEVIGGDQLLQSQSLLPKVQVLPL